MVAQFCKANMNVFSVRVDSLVWSPFEVTTPASYFLIKDYVRNSFIRSGKYS
jgi:hypothetical protein